MECRVAVALLRGADAASRRRLVHQHLVRAPYVPIDEDVLARGADVHHVFYVRCSPAKDDSGRVVQHVDQRNLGVRSWVMDDG